LLGAILRMMLHHLLHHVHSELLLLLIIEFIYLRDIEMSRLGIKQVETHVVFTNIVYLYYTSGQYYSALLDFDRN